MATVLELFAILTGEGELLQLKFGTPEKAWRTTDAEEVQLVQSHNTVVLLSFNQWGYGVFRSGILEAAPTLVVEMRNKLFPPTLEDVSGERSTPMSPASPAINYRGRLLIPWVTIYNLWGWLKSKEGAGAHKKLIALSQTETAEPIQPEPSEKKRPTNGRRKPAAPSAQKKQPVETPVEEEPAQEQVNLDTIESLKAVFEVADVTTRTLPSVPEIQNFAADGADSYELLEDEEKLTIWMVQDSSGFHAALLGPTTGLTYEDEHSTEEQVFRIPSVSYEELRSCTNLARLLHADGGTHADGRRLVLDSQGFVIATLLSLEHLLELFEEE